ncbi:HAD family phosphatase [Burkholderia sp. FERM BP-3421]|uniref:HAD family hydrolase n=1 Tax=Burkholderia sp. FERM BP-3421 TaxID=1494466 RepID=UPI002362EDA7|nr:HAD family phosphatase [Burkholderia sp. FERM BP-3421]WDD93365.1 HAD family phosphatase [Burkholderia sp. FERM BP-3421]
MTSFPFDAVLFDCDGVLVDSEPITNRVLAEMLGELGWAISVTETMRIFVGKAVRDEAARIEQHTGVAITADWLAQFRARRDAALEAELVAIDGAPAALHAVHQAVAGRVAVASGADLRKVRMQLAKVGISDYFGEHVFSGHDLPRSKPHPDVYLTAARALAVDPARCAVVEDTVTGATAGVAAGATVFGYCPAPAGADAEAALRGAGVAAVFADMDALPALLAGWSRD